MRQEPSRSPSVVWEEAAGFLAGLKLLLSSYRCAEMLKRSPWRFALRVSELEEVGLGEALLQSLLREGYVEKRAALPGEPSPPARPGGQEGYVVLTAAGARAAQERLDDAEDQPSRLRADAPQGPAGPHRPRWDGLMRDLYVGPVLLKHFRRHAPNQERLLAAFEEHGWPERIDDPLPRERGVRPEDRLRETAKSLNKTLHRQGTPALRFVVESDGRGVRWKVVG